MSNLTKQAMSYPKVNQKKKAFKWFLKFKLFSFLWIRILPKQGSKYRNSCVVTWTMVHWMNCFIINTTERRLMSVLVLSIFSNKQIEKSFSTSKMASFQSPSPNGESDNSIMCHVRRPFDFSNLLYAFIYPKKSIIQIFSRSNTNLVRFPLLHAKR